MKPTFAVFAVLIGASLLACHVASAKEADAPPIKTIRKPIREFLGHRDRVDRVIFSADGALAASCGEDKTVRIWDVSSGKPMQTLRGHTRKVTDLAFSPDGTLLASGSEDSLVKVWEVKTGEQAYELDGHHNRVNCVAYHPDGKRVLSGCCDHLLRVWDASAERVILKLPDRSCVEHVAITSDGLTAVTGNYEGSICIFDLTSGKRSFVIPAFQGTPIVGLVLTHDGKRLVASGYASAGVWDIKTGAKLSSFKQPGNEGRVLAISPEDRYIAIVHDQKVRLLEMESGKPIVAFDKMRTSPQSAAFSPDGRYLISAGGGVVYPTEKESHYGLFLWDLKSALEQ